MPPHGSAEPAGGAPRGGAAGAHRRADARWWGAPKTGGGGAAGVLFSWAHRVLVVNNVCHKQEVYATAMNLRYLQQIAEVDAEMHARWMSMAMRCDVW